MHQQIYNTFGLLRLSTSLKCASNRADEVPLKYQIFFLEDEEIESECK
jgi:hypothetical protein